MSRPTWAAISFCCRRCCNRRDRKRPASPHGCSFSDWNELAGSRTGASSPESSASRLVDRRAQAGARRPSATAWRTRRGRRRKYGSLAVDRVVKRRGAPTAVHGCASANPPRDTAPASWGRACKCREAPRGIVPACLPRRGELATPCRLFTRAYPPRATSRTGRPNPRPRRCRRPAESPETHPARNRAGRAPRDAG